MRPVAAPALTEITKHRIKMSAILLQQLKGQYPRQIIKVMSGQMNTMPRMCVTDIIDAMRLTDRSVEQSEVSQALAKLRRAGIVTVHRDGKYMWYTLVPDRVDKINRVCAMLAHYR